MRLVLRHSNNSIVVTLFISILVFIYSSGRNNAAIVHAMQDKPRQWGYWESDGDGNGNDNSNEGNGGEKQIEGAVAASFERDVDRNSGDIHNAEITHSDDKADDFDPHAVEGTSTATAKISAANEAAAEAATEEEVLFFAHTNLR